MNIAFRFLALLAAITVMPLEAQSAWSEWLPGNQYQSEFNYHASRGYYPRKVSANVFDGVVHYRGDFVKTPRGHFRYATHHGLTDRYFDAYDEEYASRGYEIIWHAKIRYNGRSYNQAVWVQK